MPTPGVRNLIREGKTHQIYSLIQTGASHGMQTMDASLAGLVRARPDHDGHRRDALLEPRGAAQAGRRSPPDADAGEGRLMATFAFKAVDLAGIPQAGEIDGADKQSVTAELKGRGLKVMALEEKKCGPQDGAAARARSGSRPPS